MKPLRLKTSPDIYVLEDFLADVVEGSLIFPNEENQIFRWKKELTVRLIESLYFGYPIGTFVLWGERYRQTSFPFSTLTTIGGCTVEGGEGYSCIVADGFHRTTAMVGALSNGRADSNWRVLFNLETEEFSLDDSSPNTYSVHELYGNRNLFSLCKKLESEGKKELIEAAREFYDRLHKTRLSVVRITNGTWESAKEAVRRLDLCL